MPGIELKRSMALPPSSDARCCDRDMWTRRCSNRGRGLSTLMPSTMGICEVPGGAVAGSTYRIESRSLNDVAMDGLCTSTETSSERRW